MVPSGSNKADGSSKKITSGSSNSTDANASRCFIPCDKLWINVCGGMVSSPTLCKTFFILASMSCRGTCKFSSTKANSSRSEEHTSELQSRGHLVCRLLLEKKKKH